MPLALEGHFLFGADVALGALFGDENRPRVAIVREQPHKETRRTEILLCVLVDEDVYHPVMRHVVALENRRDFRRVDVALPDQKALRRIAYGRMRRIERNVAVVGRHASRAYEAHVENRSGDDAEKRVFPPELKRDDERTGEIRPRRAPLEPRIRVDDQRGYDHRRDEIAEARDPFRQLPVSPGEHEERQSPKRIVHEKARGDYAEHV